MKKSELVLQVKRGINEGAKKALLELFETLLAESREANDSNRGEEFLVTQGRVQNCKDLKKLFAKEKKG